MRLYLCVGAALLVAAIALPQTAAAQKFQNPTKEELQMTSDPKAPGAPAVYLYREETTDNHTHFISSYARIKVLTEKGKEYATVEVPYTHGSMAEPVIEGRTIHADGTVIPLTGKASDLLVFKSYHNHEKAAVFNLPSVEVGSILEYKWTISMVHGDIDVPSFGEADLYYSSAYASSTPAWDVQQEIFVHKESFYFNPFNELESSDGGHNQITYFVDGEETRYIQFTERLPANTHVIMNPNGSYTLDARDVPAFVHEAYAPPENAFRYQVRFFYTPAVNSDVYWNDEPKRWSKRVDDFAEQTRAIQDAARQITAGADTPEAKARKLYDAVQALDNTNFSRAKTEEERKQLHQKKNLKNAEDVWREKSGSSNDIAELYLALARAAGLNADGLQVADRSKRIFDAGLLSLHQFDALLVVLHIDGKDIYLDPGEKLCPFGQLHWSHTLAGGLQQNVKGHIYTPPNSAKDAISAHSADLTLDAQGNVTGAVKILMNGPSALHWRQLNLTSGPDEVKKQLNESLRTLLPQGISAEADNIQGIDTSAGFLSISTKVSGPLASAAGKRLLLPGFFFSTSARQEFVSEEKREIAVDLHYAEQIIDDTLYHLPAGFSIESAPQPAQLVWPDHAALVVKTAPGAGSIDIKHIFARAFVLLKPADYPALRDYYQKIAANDQQQLVLTTSAAPGN